MKIAVIIFLVALVALLLVFISAIITLFKMGENEELCDFGYIEGDDDVQN